MADSLPALAFLGAGSMGGAILRGVVASGIRVDGGITATNRSTDSAAALDGLTLSFSDRLGTAQVAPVGGAARDELDRAIDRVRAAEPGAGTGGTGR